MVLQCVTLVTEYYCPNAVTVYLIVRVNPKIERTITDLDVSV